MAIVLNKAFSIVVTCEHGGCDVPLNYKPLFEGKDRLLQTHRGYDRGALELAKELSKKINAPLYFSEITRLLVDLNRSVGNRALFSEITKNLTKEEKLEILNGFYTPYRNEVEKEIGKEIERGRGVIHLSVHTFTPELNGKVRDADIGLLYDPRREWEMRFVREWIRLLKGEWKVRLNYPYKGQSDGFTTALRKRFGDDKYVGIELEVNQRFAIEGGVEWLKLKEDIVQTGIKLNMNKL